MQICGASNVPRVIEVAHCSTFAAYRGRLVKCSFFRMQSFYSLWEWLRMIAPSVSSHYFIAKSTFSVCIWAHSCLYQILVPSGRSPRSHLVIRMTFKLQSLILPRLVVGMGSTAALPQGSNSFQPDERIRDVHKRWRKDQDPGRTYIRWEDQAWDRYTFLAW